MGEPIKIFVPKMLSCWNSKCEKYFEREVAETMTDSVGRVQYVCPYCGYPYNQ